MLSKGVMLRRFCFAQFVYSSMNVTCMDWRFNTVKATSQLYATIVAIIFILLSSLLPSLQLSSLIIYTSLYLSFGVFIHSLLFSLHDTCQKQICRFCPIQDHSWTLLLLRSHVFFISLSLGKWICVHPPSVYQQMKMLWVHLGNEEESCTDG